MPGFGTTDRTYNNALDLCRNLGTDLKRNKYCKSMSSTF